MVMRCLQAALVGSLLLGNALPAVGAESDAPGLFLGAGLARVPDAFDLRIGIEAPVTPGLSVNGCLLALFHQRASWALSGFGMGARWAVPARVSPFIGLGGQYGFAKVFEDAAGDGIDNDHDGRVDEAGEVDDVSDDDMLTLAPELGLHFWVTPAARFSLSWAHHISSYGRRSDFDLISLRFGLFLKDAVPR